MSACHFEWKENLQFGNSETPERRQTPTVQICQHIIDFIEKRPIENEQGLSNGESKSNIQHMPLAAAIASAIPALLSGADAHGPAQTPFRPFCLFFLTQENTKLKKPIINQWFMRIPRNARKALLL